jgi:predicted O-methyltransferase YrrM
MNRIIRKLLNKSGKKIPGLLTLYSAEWLKNVINNYPNKFDDIFMKVGLLPILDHYYQPLMNPKKHLTKSLRSMRDLPGINFNIDEQLVLLDKFNFNDELLNFSISKKKDCEFFYNNDTFSSGDAEFLYNIIRNFKPRKIIEIGCGFSTLMIRNAIEKNERENNKYYCQHICIEPFEQQWLEKMNIEVLRQKVELVDKCIFKELGYNDILFIDSSHIIRPQGDVLFEYLEILPILKTGVLIHIHDIFTPNDYLDEWIYNHKLWNEQYLLEAFLTFNNEFRIIGSLNFLAHHYYEKLADKCPIFAEQKGHEPGSFWLIKN